MCVLSKFGKIKFHMNKDEKFRKCKKRPTQVIVLLTQDNKARFFDCRRSE